jgi:hypothetical protein
MKPVHAAESRYLHYAQHLTSLPQHQPLNLSEQACLLDSCVLKLQESDTNAQFAASFLQGDLTLVLSIMSPKGNLQLKGHDASVPLSTLHNRSMQPTCFSFVRAGTTIPVAGDACFVFTIVRAGTVHPTFLLLKNLQSPSFTLQSALRKPSQQFVAMLESRLLVVICSQWITNPRRSAKKEMPHKPSLSPLHLNSRPQI